MRHLDALLTKVISAGDGSVPNAVPNFSEMNKVKSRTAQMHQAFRGKDLQSMKNGGRVLDILHLILTWNAYVLAAAASAAQTKNKDKQASFRSVSVCKLHISLGFLLCS